MTAPYLDQGTALSINSGTVGDNMADAGELIDLQLGPSSIGHGIKITDSGAYTGTGLILITANGLTTGKVINIPHTTSVIASGGSLINLSSTSIDTATTSGSLLNLSSTASTAGTQFLQTYSGLTTGIGQSIVSNALTSGKLLSLASSSTGQTSGTFLDIAQTGVTTGYTGNLLNISSSSTTGAAKFLNILADASTVGTGIELSMDALTTGKGINITSTSAGQTSASLLNIAQTGVTTGFTGSLVNISSSSTTGAGSKFLNIVADASTVGTGINLSMAAMTSGVGISITGSGASMSTGKLIDLQLGANTTGNGLAIVSSGAYSGAGIISITADSATNGTGVYISMTGRTGGQALAIIGGTGMANGTYLANLDLGAATAGAGFIAQTSGAYTGTGLGIISAPNATSGEMLLISSSGLTSSGHAISIVSGSTSGGIIIAGNGNTATSIDADGQVRIGFSTTTSSVAVCSTLGAGAAPVSGTSYFLRDCAGTITADYAEMYPVETGIEYGDILTTGTTPISVYAALPDGSGLDPTNAIGSVTSLVKSVSEYQANIIGIASDNHGDFSSAGYNVMDADNPMPVALNGRVPVKIANTSAPIVAGDYITTSSEAGKGMKATLSGVVIGKALESWIPDNGQATVMVFVEQGYSTGSGTDLAEMYYSTDETIAKGDLVRIDDNIHAGVAKTNGTYDGTILGIVASRPGLVLHDPKEAHEGTAVLVALVGRVPVKVTTANGDVHAGDLLTSSAIPGVAMKATAGGRVIGQALSSYTDAGEGIVQVFINNSYAPTEVFAQINAGASVTNPTVDPVAPAFVTTADFATALNEMNSSLNAHVANELIITDALSAGVSGLNDRVTTLETTVSANVSALADVSTRLIALEQNSLSLTSLNLPGALEVTGTTKLTGGLQVDSISSIGSSINFASDINLIGRPLFNKDTGGFAIIHTGDTFVRVTFEKPYVTTPVVDASVTFNAITDEIVAAQAEADYFASGMHLIVTRKDVTGFTIMLNAPATTDLSFNWIALAITDARTDESVGSTLGSTPTPVVAGATDPAPIDPTPIPDPTPVVDPAPIIDPVPVDPTPVVDPTPIIDPAPIVDPAPIDPVLVDPIPAPIDPAPIIDPVPVDPAPVI